MSRPVCEELTTIPATQSGWVQWGTLSADGQTFTPLYGLEAALPYPSALYYLTAAGVCDVRGKDAQGALIPTEQPKATPVPPTVAAQSLQTQPPPIAVPEPQSPTQSGVSPVAVTLLAIAVLGMALGAFYSNRRRKSTDKTSHPGEKYEGRNPFGGQ